ncbi:MAG: CIA30 family protein [Woeseiaceae bacterium]
MTIFKLIYRESQFCWAIGLLLMTFTTAALSASDSGPDGRLLLTDFTPASSDLGWYVLNDNVMGGRSAGGFSQDDDHLTFTGSTNTNGGGFSSIRTNPLQLDLSRQTGIELYVKGDGRRYTWQLTTAARWRGRPVSFWAEFETSDGTWSKVRIPFSSFVPKFRGYQLDGPTLDPGLIEGMGLMIYDNQDGAFELQMASVHAYSEIAAFEIEQYLWKNRVLVISAPNEDDENLKAQQAAVALTSEEFEDRDMVLVTLLEDLPSTAKQRRLTISEATAARAALGVRSVAFSVTLIGKDGSIKLSAKTNTSMTEIYALIDGMPMRQREMSDR